MAPPSNLAENIATLVPLPVGIAVAAGSATGAALASTESKLSASLAASFTLPLPCLAMGVSIAMPSASRILLLASAWLARFRRALAACHLASSLPLTTKATSSSHPPPWQIAPRFSSDAAAQFPSCSAAWHCSSLVPFCKAFTTTWTCAKSPSPDALGSLQVSRCVKASRAIAPDSSSSSEISSSASRPPQAMMAWATASLRAKQHKAKAAFARPLPFSMATNGGTAPSASMAWRCLAPRSRANWPKRFAAAALSSSEALGSLSTSTFVRIPLAFQIPTNSSLAMRLGEAVAWNGVKLFETWLSSGGDVWWC